MERFVCMDCRALSPLGEHGRCSVCNSEAVVSEHSHYLAKNIFQHRVDKSVQHIFEISGVK